MTSNTLLQITQHIRQLPNTKQAAQYLVDWVTAQVCPAYLMLFDQLMTAPSLERNAEFVRWLTTRSNWRDIQEIEVTSEAIFIPLIYGGRTQGMIALETSDESALQIIPLAELLAVRLDAEYTAKMTHRARKLTEKVNQATNLDDMLQQCVQGILPVFGASVAVIFKFEPDDLTGESIAEHPSQMTIGRDMGITNYQVFSELFTNDDVVILEDAETDPITKQMQTAMRTVGIEQIVVAPMFAFGRLVGALAVGFNLPQSIRLMTGREREMLRLLANSFATSYMYTRRLDIPQQSTLDDTIFKQLVDKAKVAVDIHTPDGEVIYRNSEWDAIFGNAEIDETSLQFKNRFPTSTHNSVDEIIYPNAHRQHGWMDMVTLKRNDNQLFEANVSLVALRDNQEAVIGYSSVTTDITDLHDVLHSLQQQTTRLGTAASVSNVIITTPKLDSLMQQVLRLICSQFHYDYAQIWTVDNENYQLNVQMACDINGEVMDSVLGASSSLNDPTTARWVILNRQSLLIQDTAQDERQHMVLSDVQSEYVLLLQTANQILGVLVIQSKHINAFNRDDAEILQSISEQLAIGMYNANLFAQLQERLTDMNAMGEVSLLVQAAFDYEALVTRIYEAMRRVHPEGDFALALYHPAHNTIELDSYHQGHYEKTYREIGSDIISRMLLDAVPIFWRSGDERRATSAYFKIPDTDLTQSFLGLPLIAKDKVLGALYTQSDDIAAFDENDLQFMLTLVNSAAFAIENMRLIEDTKQRVREMEIIHSISQTLSETFGGEDMWSRLLVELGELFSHGMVTVALYDALFDTFKIPDIEANSVILTPPPEALTRVVLETGVTLDFQDLSQEDDRLEKLGVDMFQLNLGALRSWMATALRSRNNEIIGIIALQSDQPQTFSERDLSLLNMVSAQISLALDNERLLVAEQERREVANSLIDMGRMMTSSLNIDEVFERIFQQVRRLLPYQRAAILIPQSHDNIYQMTIHAVDGFDPDVTNTQIDIHYESPLSHVLQSQETVTIPQVKNAQTWYRQPEIIQSEQVQSWMGVPLVSQSNIIGLLTIDSKNSSYTEDDAPAIFALARQAAVAVENARLHTQAEHNLVALQNRAERLASMHQLATYVSTSLSQDQIFDHTSKLLTDLFKVPYAGVIRIDSMDGNGYTVAEHPDTVDATLTLIKGTPVFDMFEQIVKANDAVHIHNIPENHHQMLTTDFAGGYVIAPLIAYDIVLGAMLLGFDDEQRTFDEENLETFMTITAQVAIAVRNAELFHDALEASRLKNEFLATVSHELRTPLNAIIGYSELLLSGTYGELESPQVDRMERVYRSGRHLLTIINDILDLSKIEANKMDLQPTDLNIKHLIQDALGTVSPQAESKDLPLIVDIPDDLPLIYVDINRMRQVIVNLLSNAVKFTAEGQVTIRAELVEVSLRDFPELSAQMVARNNQWVKISVTDTGIGIPEKDRKIIFEVFTQGDGSSIREYEGTGLGLAITKRLIQMHNGHIYVESEEGEGSTFSILVPTAEVVKPQYSLDADDTRPLVFLVDEDELTLKLIAEYLDEDQYQVISMRTTDELWSALNDVTPDAIITDLVLADTEGLDVLEQLKAREDMQSVPIIICTIFDREADVLGLGARAFIKKPIMRNQLVAILNDVLE